MREESVRSRAVRTGGLWALILLSFSLVLSALHPTVGFFLSSQKSLSGTLTVSKIKANCQTRALALALQLPLNQQVVGLKPELKKQIVSYFCYLCNPVYSLPGKTIRKKSTSLPKLLLKVENNSTFSRSTKHRTKSFFISFFQCGKADEDILFAKGLWQAVQDWQF